ncbi:MAG: hydroxymethylbilane synthase [Chloroflexi bacterium]|nr:hydroxymethylbilane synthase [Chloroflexota bacterium]
MFRIGTRGSRLALRQTDIVLEALRKAHPQGRFEVVAIRTTGDKLGRASLAEIGGRGVFVVELEKALLRNGIDIAVHSLKDLPSRQAEGLAIAAVPPRGEVHDALFARDGRKLADLPEGAVVGTGSPRRAAQVRALRPDITVADIRGNVDTRLAKVERGEYDGTVLAAAGLARLDILEMATEVLSLEAMLPAAGQGALALEARADDAEAVALARSIDDPETHTATDAERAFERRLGGGCQAAIAAYGAVKDGVLRLRGLVAEVEGRRILRDEIEGPVAEAESLGVRLVERVIEMGAAALLAPAPSRETAP